MFKSNVSVSSKVKLLFFVAVVFCFVLFCFFQNGCFSCTLGDVTDHQETDHYKYGIGHGSVDTGQGST